MTLLLFTNKGNIYKVPSFLISNVMKEKYALESIIDGYSKNEKIIDVYSLKILMKEVWCISLLKRE